MASSKSRRQNNDLISNVPDIVTDKILELLPIQTLARTSMLSNQWRRNWLSQKRLIFDEEFCEQQVSIDGTCDWQKCSNIISSVLLHHNGPIHEFNLYISSDVDKDCINLSQWLSFLSKNEGIRRIDISNRTVSIPISSHIFLCSGLVQLELDGVDLSPPLCGFGGFLKLQHLVLLNVFFNQPDILCGLIAKCRNLVMLRIEDCSGMYHIAIDIPSLETLIIKGDEFESLAFRDVCNLKSLSICLKETMAIPKTMETIVTSQTQCIQFGGQLYKVINSEVGQFLCAGGVMISLPVTFNHLNTLCLNDLHLNDSSVLGYVFTMVERCPYIEKLNISVKPGENAQGLKLAYNYNLKMDHLVKVTIEGITGSRAELKLIEYLLTISTVLEKLFYKCGKINTKSELKLTRALTGLPRASAKARLICLR